MRIEAAAQAASGTTSEVQAVLDASELLWGDEFAAGHDERGYWSAPHGDPESKTYASDPVELGDLMNGAIQ
ncbi:MAG: hypothetical protein ACRDNW_15110 [Trebonia sp.]